MKRQVDLLQDVADKVLLAGDSVLGRISISPLPKYAYSGMLFHPIVCTTLG